MLSLGAMNVVLSLSISPVSLIPLSSSKIICSSSLLQLETVLSSILTALSFDKEKVLSVLL